MLFKLLKKGNSHFNHYSVFYHPTQIIERHNCELACSKDLFNDLYTGLGTNQPIKCTNIIKSKLNTVPINNNNLKI